MRRSRGESGEGLPGNPKAVNEAACGNGFGESGKYFYHSLMDDAA